jgi:2-keto-4-pentenoate hydratase/2-oxohepta-3-ene-1,7-dioic acid hydratase in catechol pathway
MKIIRHLTPSGPAYAALQPDGSAREIAGDIFGDYRLTGQTVKPGKLLAPLVPAGILAIGLNYKKHAEEGGKGVPAQPMLFMKSLNTVQNPGDPIEIPQKLASTEVDFECELAVVIGKRCCQFCQGKSFDTFCPLGPVLVTRDEIPNPNALGIKTTLNGTVLQDWNTNDMCFDVPTLIEFLSGSKTLLPGTVILTGTPHGVGFARKPPIFMQAGDTVSIEIEKIGTLTNPVVNETL